MIEVLNIPEFRNRVAPISVAQYHRMIESGVFQDRKYELIEGALVEKMSKSHLHCLLVDILLDLLKEFCPRDQFWVRQEAPITLDTSEPEPDVSVVRGKRLDFDANPTNALFVAEVSITTLAEDRAKAPGFARADVPEFWIICPETRKTEVYREPANGEYTQIQTIEAETTIESTALPGFSFTLADELID